METQKITNALLTLVAATLVIVISVSTVRAQESASGEDPASAQVTPLFFEDVRVFDGEQVIEQADVVVEDGVITSVDEDLEAPENAEVIDGEGRTLLPGLIDAHVHVLDEDALKQSLVFGVTTVFDMGNDFRLDQQLRAEQEAGQAAGRADLLSAGTLATAPGGHGTEYGLEIPTLSDPAEAEAFVEARVEEGSDYIKVVLDDFSNYGADLPTLSEETVAAVIAAAAERGLLSVTHVAELEAAKAALRAGTSGLAHTFVDAAPDQEFIDLASEHDAFVIPTLTVYQRIGTAGGDGGALADDARLAPYLSSADLENLGNPYSGFEDLSFDHAVESVRLLHEAGVPVLAGTDAMQPGTVFGASLHRELELLVEAGLTPAEAMSAATAATADAFGLDDRGRVAAGLRADLVLVDGDPAQDITSTRDIVGVWKGGVRVDRQAYREQVAADRAAAAQRAEALAQSDSVLISDFEAGEPSAAFGQPWATSSDELAGGTSSAELQVEGGGATGSGYALRVTGEVTQDAEFPFAGALYMPGAMPYAPTDLSSKPVLVFNARAESGQYVVMTFCQNLGEAPAVQPIEVSPEWRGFRVDLSSLGECDPSGVTAIIFAAVQPGAFDLSLDDAKLLAK